MAAEKRLDEVLPLVLAQIAQQGPQQGAPRQVEGAPGVVVRQALRLGRAPQVGER